MTTESIGEETREYRLEGRVQGVGFRWWTIREAESLGLRGWVRNLRDGAVEVHAGGPAHALDELERRLHEGPRSAHVQSVERRGPGRALPERGFEVRHAGGRL